MRRTTLVTILVTGFLLLCASTVAAGNVEPAGPYWPNGTKLVVDAAGSTVTVSFPSALNSPYYYWIGAYPSKSGFPVASARVDSLGTGTVTVQLTLNPGAYVIKAYVYDSACILTDVIRCHAKVP